MRIIAGIARNIELAAPPGIGVRPTAVRARKALFDSIGSRLAGSVVLDLCAGSGALALEAASRGAAAGRRSFVWPGPGVESGRFSGGFRCWS